MGSEMCIRDRFTSGNFQRVLPDPKLKEINKPARIILATGKIAVNLIKEREERGVNNVAIVRLEQLYPIPFKELEETLSAYPDGTPVTWVQEEPLNMGACNFIRINFGNSFFGRWPFANFVTRPESASPSTGSMKAHVIEHNELIEAALTTNVKAKV